jgi:hypothetical protein
MQQHAYWHLRYSRKVLSRYVDGCCDGPPRTVSHDPTGRDWQSRIASGHHHYALAISIVAAVQPRRLLGILDSDTTGTPIYHTCTIGSTPGQETFTEVLIIQCTVASVVLFSTVLSTVVQLPCFILSSKSYCTCNLSVVVEGRRRILF